MSHISTVDIEIKDLEALKQACPSLGLEFQEGVTKYRWFGRSVGGTIPEGWTEAELGTCDHNIRLKDNSRAYSVGVCRRRDGKPGYTLQFDSWNNGYGLMQVIGPQAGLLKQQYAKQVAIKQARREGFKVTESVDATGAIVLTATK